MTQQEFTQRTNVKVSEKEFDAINEVYMNSDLGKDDFCKAWVKMNISRVKKINAEQREAKKQEKIKERLTHIYLDIRNWHDADNHPAFTYLSDSERRFLQEQGIETGTTYEFGYTHYVTVSTLTYTIRERLGMNK